MQEYIFKIKVKSEDDYVNVMEFIVSLVKKDMEFTCEKRNGELTLLEELLNDIYNQTTL